MNKLTIIAALLLCESNSSLAETRLSFSPALLHFDYTEYSTTDQELNNEAGWLPGLNAGLSYAITPVWSVAIDTSYYQGTVDYHGQTQQGIPHTTDSGTTLFRLGARLDRSIYKDIRLFIGAMSHQWKRDIKDKNNISGINETYEWYEYSMGLDTDFFVTDRDRINLAVSYLLIRNATVFVDLSRVDLGTTTLDLGDGTGGYLSLNWFQQYKKDINLGLGLFFEGWQFGRSNTKQTENSSAITFVTEPRSETRNIGLKFNIEYMF